MHGRRNPFVAQEGIPLLAIVLAIALWLGRYHGLWYALLPLVAFVLLYLVFRDPRRVGPSVALGVLSPVDGKVLEIERIEIGDIGAPVLRVLIKVDSFGTYTARSPVEGYIKDLGKKALWLQTDEGADVVLTFRGYRLGLAPKTFALFGERLGQGQRCANLRLTRFAEVQWPADGQTVVEVGQVVEAGIDVIGKVPRLT